jgi:hypothetical protein
MFKHISDVVKSQYSVYSRMIIYICICIYIHIYTYIYTHVDNNHICGSHHQYWKSIPYLSCRNCQRVTICFRLTPALHGQLDSRPQRFKSLKGGCCNEENCWDGLYSLPHVDRRLHF